jgi:hypothetical protein
MPSLHDTAISYARADRRIIPLHDTVSGQCSCNDPDCGSPGKHPRTKNGLIDAITDTNIIDKWWQQWPDANIGIVGDEGIDIDNKGNPDANELYEEWAALVETLDPGLVDRLLCEGTPSGGYHLAWDCETIEGSQKLAQRMPTKSELRKEPKLKAITLIETRGSGGYFAVTPSQGYTLYRGDWCNLPAITEGERLILLDCARAMNKLTSGKLITGYTSRQGENGLKPGVDYSERVTNDEIAALLKKHGWKHTRSRSDNEYFCRPGKKGGISASWSDKERVFYVFSSNAAPFDQDHGYGAFAVYAHLEHNGDFSAAARALVKEGYGDQVLDSPLLNNGKCPKCGKAPRKSKYNDEWYCNCQSPALKWPADPIATEQADPVRPVSHSQRKIEYVTDWRQSGVTLAELQYKQFEPERWIIENILPEGACLLAAKYKSKKSWLSLALSLAVSMGGKALGRLAVSSGRVLYLDLEGKQQRIQKRTRAILGVRNILWPDNFHIFTQWPQGDEGLDRLEQWLKAYSDTALAIIDVLADFRRPIEKHEQPYQYDRATVQPINSLFEHYHATAILVHHFNKAKNDDIMDSISGTTGLPSAVNTMWGLSRDVNDSSITVLSLRGRDLENEEPIALRWDSYLNSHIIEGPAHEVAISTERKAVLALLSDDMPRTPKEIAAELGKTAESVKQLLRKLLSDESVDKAGYGKYAILRKVDHSDHSDHSGTCDHSDHSLDGSKSDRSIARVIPPDHSVLEHQEGSNGKSDQSDRDQHMDEKMIDDTTLTDSDHSRLAVLAAQSGQSNTSYQHINRIRDMATRRYAMQEIERIEGEKK